jgi:hypothetical protein
MQIESINYYKKMSISFAVLIALVPLLSSIRRGRFVIFPQVFGLLLRFGSWLLRRSYLPRHATTARHAAPRHAACIAPHHATHNYARVSLASRRATTSRRTAAALRHAPRHVASPHDVTSHHATRTRRHAAPRHRATRATPRRHATHYLTNNHRASCLYLTPS